MPLGVITIGNSAIQLRGHSAVKSQDDSSVVAGWQLAKAFVIPPGRSGFSRDTFFLVCHFEEAARLRNLSV